jgi:hypothetical protein
MLSWGGASDQIKNVSSLAGDLSFLLFGLESLFDLCYWVRRPQLRERSTKCLMIWKDHWSQMNPSHHSWLLGQSYPTIGLILIAIGVESEYRSITRSLSGWGPKGEHNASITTDSEVTGFLRLLKLIWRSDSSMIAIAARSEVTDFLRLLKLIWWSDSSMIAIAAGSEVSDFCCVWRYHTTSFRLVVPCWLGLNKFLLSWWHITYWSLNAHRFYSVSPDLSHRFAPTVGLC